MFACSLCCNYQMHRDFLLPCIYSVVNIFTKIYVIESWPKATVCWVHFSYHEKDTCYLGTIISQYRFTRTHRREDEYTVWVKYIVFNIKIIGTYRYHCTLNSQDVWKIHLWTRAEESFQILDISGLGLCVLIANIFNHSSRNLCLSCWRVWT
jgi:hypothetical protein